MDAFDKIPENYDRLCNILEDFKPPSQEIFDKLKEDIDSHKRKTIVGAGRSGIIADVFKDFLRNLGYSEVYGPDDVPRIFDPKDLVISVTGSGVTKVTTEISKDAKSAGAKVVGFTSDENSEFAKKVSDYIIHVKGRTKKDYVEDYYAKQLVGVHTPIAPLGSIFELRTLYTILSFIGSVKNNNSIHECYKDLCNLSKDYRPEPNSFREFYRILPKPRSVKNPLSGKTIGVGDGLSGDVCKFFLTRLSNCAKKDEERECSFYRDTGNIKLSLRDLLLVVSGCGRYLPYELTKVVKEEVGTKAVAITSYLDSPLASISDVKIYVPGRVVEKVKGLRGSYVPTDPKKSIFELRTILSLESFVYAIAKIEGITEKDMKEKHSPIT
jgi:6-phospho-3-hexuloisomerase